jgi:hypothetical protein
MFTNTDLRQLEARGISQGEAERQLRLLREAPPATQLDRPCTIGDGIVRLDSAQHADLIAAAADAAADGRLTKFVPASGAATRMFKDLDTRAFFDQLDDFPFGPELRERSGVRGPVAGAEQERLIVRTLLQDMRYAELPKGLIAFHRVKGVVRTAFEEHLLEGAQYTRDRDGVARTHFTVAPEFGDEFSAELERIRPAVERATGARLEVTFSQQHPSTDTLAGTPEGELFRTPDGALLLRPAGHGALLRNLQLLNADLVVIKNVDNVKPVESSADVVLWKRLLIGYLVTLLDSVPADRPVRVCGVVRNEGEPGGAPFWVRGNDGRVTAQIVESSQVDLEDPHQRRVFESSTHFNPVDVVCALRSRAGQPFDLPAFVDPSAVFRAQKSHDGRDVIALERPGLWNGAMAGWHTVFVEVPASTFAPVKTVFDLLRPQHQSL